MGLEVPKMSSRTLNRPALKVRKTRQERVKASSKILKKKLQSMFVTRNELSAATDRMTEEQRRQLREARARAEALLSKPSMSADALRARAKRAAQWEKEHGDVSALVGIRR
jgi:uncharacterized protein (DUF1778 family)